MNAIDRATLLPRVRRALDRESIRLTNWDVRPIHGGFEANAGIYRFVGRAQEHGKTIPWSLILKVIRPPDDRDDPAHWNYLKRDPLAYRSGLLDDLPGSLAAPRCHGIVEQPDGTIWLWLEEVTDEIGPTWPLARYGLAARHLGQFNGAYLAGRPLPTQPWLSTQWLRSLLAQAAPQIARLPSALDHPLVRRLYPKDVQEGLARLWAERTVFLEALERLPQTLCHRDAFRRNLFARRGPDGSARTVAIDWVFLGRGAVGAELVALIVATVGFREVALEEVTALEEAAFAGYLAGLHDVGWHGDARLVRFGYTAAAPLRYLLGGTGNLLPLLLDETSYGWFAQMWGGSVEEYVAYWLEMFRFLLRLADEARSWMERGRGGSEGEQVR